MGADLGAIGADSGGYYSNLPSGATSGRTSPQEEQTAAVA